MSNPAEGQFERLKKALTGVDELAMTVLRGHLVIEEQLERILANFFFHPEFLRQANLRFAQKMAIARSFSLTEHRNGIWDVLAALNALRNELAHGLYSAQREQKFAKLHTVYLNEGPYQEADIAGRPEHEIAGYAIALVFGFLQGWRRVQITSSS